MKCTTGLTFRDKRCRSSGCFPTAQYFVFFSASVLQLLRISIHSTMRYVSFVGLFGCCWFDPFWNHKAHCFSLLCKAAAPAMEEPFEPSFFRHSSQENTPSRHWAAQGIGLHLNSQGRRRYNIGRISEPRTWQKSSRKRSQRGPQKRSRNGWGAKTNFLRM